MTNALPDAPSFVLHDNDEYDPETGNENDVIGKRHSGQSLAHANL